MKIRALLIGVAALALAIPTIAFSADPDQPTSRPAAGDRPPGQRGGPGGQMNGILFGQDPLMPTVTAVGIASLQPDFELSKDQKTKIQSIRDTYKTQLDDWRKDHADDIKKLQDEATDAMQNAGGGNGGGNGGGGGREAFQKIAQDRNDLVNSAPKADDAIQQITAVLTDDQQKAVTAVKDEIAQERQAQMDAMQKLRGGGAGGRGGFRNRGGGGNGGGNGGGANGNGGGNGNGNAN